MPSPQTLRARQLRREQTPYEAALWKLIRENKIPGFSFRRQHPVDRFIADFACPAARLIIELDGNSHDLLIERDIERDRILSGLGWTTLRFLNSELMNNSHGVWAEIHQFIVRSGGREAVNQSRLSPP